MNHTVGIMFQNVSTMWKVTVKYHVTVNYLKLIRK